MKKVLALATVAAALTLTGAVDTARAEHCPTYGRSGGGISFGFSSRSYRPSYYRPSYGYSRYSYSRPSSGFTYARPGFSISIGNRYRPSYGYSRFGGYGRSSHFGHRH